MEELFKSWLEKEYREDCGYDDDDDDVKVISYEITYWGENNCFAVCSGTIVDLSQAILLSRNRAYCEKIQVYACFNDCGNTKDLTIFDFQRFILLAIEKGELSESKAWYNMYKLTDSGYFKVLEELKKLFAAKVSNDDANFMLGCYMPILEKTVYDQRVMEDNIRRVSCCHCDSGVLADDIDKRCDTIFGLWKKYRRHWKGHYTQRGGEITEEILQEEG